MAVGTNSYAVTGSSAQAVAANRSRARLVLTNNGTTVMWLSYGGTAASGTGIRLATNAILIEELDSNARIYKGAVNAISAGAAPQTLAIEERDDL